MTVSLLVVLYDCKIHESTTIKSLLSIHNRTSTISLIIWNNGPNLIEPDIDYFSILSNAGIKCTFIQTAFNAPLSWIYNYFLDNFLSEINILADHDSKFLFEYFKAATHETKFFVRLPIIHAYGAPRSPTVNGTFFKGPFTLDQEVIAIGSGIVLSKDAVKEIVSCYGNVFDEHFALYGVDTSMFIRLFKARLIDRLVTIPGFEHSLSRLETEDFEKKKFRRIERTYDLVLTARHYPSLKYLSLLVKQILLLFAGKSEVGFNELLKTLITGTHPRASKKFRPEFEESTLKLIKFQ